MPGIHKMPDTTTTQHTLAIARSLLGTAVSSLLQMSCISNRYKRAGLEEHAGLFRNTSSPGGPCEPEGHRHSCSEPFSSCQAHDQAPEQFNAPER